MGTEHDMDSLLDRFKNSESEEDFELRKLLAPKITFKMNRKEGYYWVKYHDSWLIGYYSLLGAGYHWTVMHLALNDKDFGEIDERRIERKDI